MDTHLSDLAPAPDLRRVGAHPDHWYPVAWSAEVKEGKPHAVRFCGEPVVVVRPKEGAVFALENRCAHRQVPLSEGVVTGCAIRCGYHGWTYDATGACTDVPYLGKGKLPNGVHAYPCREEAGLIFIFPGDPAKAGEAFPDLSAATDPKYKTRRFGREVACHYSFMHENLMDMNHQFLHRRPMGTIRARYRGHSRGEDWIQVKYTFARTGGKQPLGETLVFGGKRSADVNDRDVMTIRTEYPYQTLRIVPADGNLPLERPCFSVERSVQHFEDVHSCDTLPQAIKTSPVKPTGQPYLQVGTKEVLVIGIDSKDHGSLDQLLTLLEVDTDSLQDVDPDALRIAEFEQTQSILDTLVGKTIVAATIEDTRIVIETDGGNRYFFFGFMGSGRPR